MLSREGGGECSKRKRTGKDDYFEGSVCQLSLRSSKKASVAGKESLKRGLADELSGYGGGRSQRVF